MPVRTLQRRSTPSVNRTRAEPHENETLPLSHRIKSDVLFSWFPSLSSDANVIIHTTSESPGKSSLPKSPLTNMESCRKLLRTKLHPFRARYDLTPNLFHFPRSSDDLYCIHIVSLISGASIRPQFLSQLS